jgi:hypothetical protein
MRICNNQKIGYAKPQQLQSVRRSIVTFEGLIPCADEQSRALHECVSPSPIAHPVSLGPPNHPPENMTSAGASTVEVGKVCLKEKIS